MVRFLTGPAAPIPIWLLLAPRCCPQTPTQWEPKTWPCLPDSLHMRRLWIKHSNTAKNLQVLEVTLDSPSKRKATERICTNSTLQSSNSSEKALCRNQSIHKNRSQKKFTFAFITIYSSIVVAFSRSKWGVKMIFIIPVAHTYTE